SRRVLSTLGEGKRVAALGQNMVADARLVEGARVSFFFKALLAVYARRMKSGTRAEKLGAVQAFANVDRIRFRLLTQAQASRKDTAQQKEQMKQTIGEQQDEGAFLDALKQFDGGQQ